MKWKYYIPHTWDKPTDRTVWEDVYLMPALGWENKEEKKSLWLTVDGLGFKPPEDDPFDEMKDYLEIVKKLGDKEFMIDSDQCYMLVQGDDFNMEELLEYAKIFINEVFNDKDIVLIEGKYEDFIGTNEHIGQLEGLGTILEKEYGEPADNEENDD